MKRHHFSLRKPSSKVIKPEEEILNKATDYIQEIRDLIKNNLYEVSYILNIDETSICTETDRSKTIHIKGDPKVQ